MTAISTGAIAGLAVEFLAIIAAFASSGAGHGSYVATRLLFPFSSLLMLIEGEIGPLGIGVGLLQYPLYGAVVGLGIGSRHLRLPIALGVIHLIAAIACFSGLLSDFI